MSTRELRCDLTPAEQQQRAEELAAKLGELDRAEEEKKASAQAHSKRITELRARVKELGRAVAARAEWRHIECEELVDRSRGEVRVTRKDTGEVIETRPWTSEDRQLRLVPETPGSKP